MTALPRRTALAAALSLALGATAPLTAATLVSAEQPSVVAIDAARNNPNVIILRSGIIDPTEQRIDARSVGAAQTPARSSYAIVQFRKNDRAARAMLRNKGIEFLGYVPNNAYYVRLNAARLEEVSKEPAVRWAGQVEPVMKLDPTLWQSRRATSGARQIDGSYRLTIRGFDGVSSTTLEDELRKAVPDFRVPLRSQRVDAAPYIVAEVDAPSLDALIEKATAIDGVAFIAPWFPTHTMNSGSNGAIQGKFLTTCTGAGPICGATPMFDHKINGSGQIVALADSGTSVDSAFFATLDKGNGPHTEITLAENPPPVPPAIGTLHPDNKIIAYWTQPQGPTDYDFVSGHGTHTAGTIVGDAAGTFGSSTFIASTPTSVGHDNFATTGADGMAPNAQLLMQDAGGNDPTSIIIADFEGTLLQAANAGARIHSDSWGSNTAGAYTTQDEAADRAMRQAENMLLVIAAGNDVPGAMAVGSPGNAKNAVTVAALGHAGSLTKASFSNAGPTADGRMKPDVAAPGSSTISARNRTTLSATVQAPQSTSKSGTSMATPVIAGNAVLMRQYFTDGFYPRGQRAGDDTIFADGFDPLATAPVDPVDALNPTGALMKAVLLNSTIPTTSPSAFPNTGTGWGRPWLDTNLWFRTTMAGGDDARRLRVFERTNATGLETGEIHEYTIANVAAGAEFRATLTWFDVAASTGAIATLVNNLDLEVVAPGGGLYRGNVFASNVSTPGGTADAKDTVEQVRFTAPVAGSYTIRVKGTSIPGDGSGGSDRQGYGLAVSGAFGLPDSGAFPAPTGLNATSNDVNGVAISANVAPGAQGFQLYRTNGSCATAKPGDFHLVAHGNTLPLIDDRTQGGYTFAYKLRGIQNDVEGNVSDCFEIVSNDTCDLSPLFDIESVTADASNTNCSVKLDWEAAQSVCPAAPTVTYNVLRSANPYFGSPTTVATGLASPTFTDPAVSNGTAYFYRVAAFDGEGNPAQLSLIKNATPSGIDGPDPGSFSDDADAHSYLAMQSPWRITNTTSSNGTYSYHLGADGQPYPDLVCASITTPSMLLTAGAVLSFQAKYDLEFEWDGVVQEISTDGGNTWIDLPPVGGYPSSFAQTAPGGTPVNACGYAASHGAFNGVTKPGSNADPNNGTAAVFKPFTTSLAAYVDQNVMIRWRFSSDPASTFSGFFLDQVQITGLPGTGSYMCTP